MTATTWILELDAFPNGDCLEAAAKALGHAILPWRDTWWSDLSLPSVNGPAVFHGSLANADRIHREASWNPGSFCSTARFECSAWYPAAKDFLLHEAWEVMPADVLVRDAKSICDRFNARELFIRPNSPLKPFSGRVLEQSRISLAALDHGFYFDDPTISVVIAPVRKVSREWRYVIVGTEVVSGSGYLADARTAVRSDDAAPWQFAARVAKALAPPETVYVLDVCESDGDLRLLELNPFSGADLYACDGIAIAERIAKQAWLR